jgi:hypothetical protein
MEPFEKTIRRVSERLYEDEKLRANLADDEAQVVLGWAQEWLTNKIGAATDENQAQQIAQDELTRVRQAVTTINTLAAKPGALKLSEAVAAFEPQMQAMTATPRAQVFKMLTQVISVMWRAHDERVANSPSVKTPSKK